MVDCYRWTTIFENKLIEMVTSRTNEIHWKPESTRFQGWRRLLCWCGRLSKPQRHHGLVAIIASRLDNITIVIGHRSLKVTISVVAIIASRRSLVVATVASKSPWPRGYRDQLPGPQSHNSLAAIVVCWRVTLKPPWPTASLARYDGLKSSIARRCCSQVCSCCTGLYNALQFNIKRENLQNSRSDGVFHRTGKLHLQFAERRSLHQFSRHKDDWMALNQLGIR